MSISPYLKQQWTNSVTHMWILWHHKQVSRAWKSNCTVTVLRHVFMNVASMTQQIDTCHIHDISIYKIPQECGKSIDNMTCMSHLSLAQSYLRRCCSLRSWRLRVSCIILWLTQTSNRWISRERKKTCGLCMMAGSWMPRTSTGGDEWRSENRNGSSERNSLASLPLMPAKLSGSGIK